MYYARQRYELVDTSYGATTHPRPCGVVIRKVDKLIRNLNRRIWIELDQPQIPALSSERINDSILCAVNSGQHVIVHSARVDRLALTVEPGSAFCTNYRKYN